MKKLLIALSLATALGSLSTAQAGTVSFADNILLQETDWSESLVFGKFDTRLGTLTSIQFDLSGSVEAEGGVENRGNSAANVTMTLGSLLTLTRPDASTLVVANPVFSEVLSLARYDRVLDYAGTSGRSTGMISSTNSSFFVSNNASDFALFSALGGGNIVLGLSAMGNSRVVGPGNLASFFDTLAAGNASVTYTYTAAAAVPVPEPASLALLLGGLGLIGVARRRASKRS